MIRKGCLLVCLAVLFCTGISAQVCNKFREVLQEANKGNLKLLRSKMSKSVPLQCIEDETEFMPNEEKLRKIDMTLEENAKVVIQEIIQQTSQLFNQNYTESAWDENSIDVLQQRLYQQIRYMKRCLDEEGQNRGIVSPKQQQLALVRLRVKAQFLKMMAFLKEEQYRLCAWENIQIHVQQYFLLIDQLIQAILQ